MKIVSCFVTASILIKGLVRCFYVLLSTKMGEQLVWFLAKHKARLGHKILKSVTVFAADSIITPPGFQNELPDLVKWPVLIWEVVDYDPKLVEDKKRVENAYVDDNGNHKLDQDGDVICPNIRYDPIAGGAGGKCLTVPRVFLPADELRHINRNMGNMVLS